ncbi:MAG: hypothetical protein LBS69_12055 [Prevotellaceae bacterium]|jgi:hypothetical protein|nr:hypothetical protein [Prevotellaceae bacterium]
MKKTFQILSMAVIVLSAASCGGEGSGAKIPQLQALDKLTPAEMTAVKANGLYGKVKAVTTDKLVLEFNEAGEIIKSGDYIYTQKSRNRYTVTGKSGKSNYSFSFEKDIRTDNCIGDDVSTAIYRFDEYGRLVRDAGYEWGTDYVYKNADALPSSSSWDNWEESEEVVWQYEYQTIDDHGNWTERKTTEITYSVVWENEKKIATETSRMEPVLETRTITYYE